MALTNGNKNSGNSGGGNGSGDSNAEAPTRRMKRRKIAYRKQKYEARCANPQCPVSGGRQFNRIVPWQEYCSDTCSTQVRKRRMRDRYRELRRAEAEGRVVPAAESEGDRKRSVEHELEQARELWEAEARDKAAVKAARAKVPPQQRRLIGVKVNPRSGGLAPDLTPIEVLAPVPATATATATATDPLVPLVPPVPPVPPDGSIND